MNKIIFELGERSPGEIIRRQVFIPQTEDENDNRVEYREVRLIDSFSYQDRERSDSIEDANRNSSDLSYRTVSIGNKYDVLDSSGKWCEAEVTIHLYIFYIYVYYSCCHIYLNFNFKI